MDHAALRPIERRMLKLADSGTDDIEIAWRFRCTPRTVRQIKACSELPRDGGAPRTGEPAGDPAEDRLRPIERRLLRWRDQGATFHDLAARFRRSAGHLQQIEALAHYKLAR